MLCNNIGTKVGVVVNYRVCVMHGIAQRAFFLHYGTCLFLCGTLCAGNDFMLVSVNHSLSRYKADQ